MCGVLDVIMRVLALMSMVTLTSSGIWMLRVLWQHRHAHRDLTKAIQETRDGLLEIVVEDAARSARLAQKFDELERREAFWKKRAKEHGWRDEKVDD